MSSKDTQKSYLELQDRLIELRRERFEDDIRDQARLARVLAGRLIEYAACLEVIRSGDYFPTLDVDGSTGRQLVERDRKIRDESLYLVRSRHHLAELKTVFGHEETETK